ncbi:MAG: glycosyltransferase family 39 protein, partial [Omnitrophica bacterium]|nr:glycosyltransferase family 39 protein [Candidatus Omnitrophota bacterium]
MLRKIRKEFFQRQGMMISALVFFSLVVLFFNLGKKSFWEPDEGRYAEISREMVESGDWLTPRLNYIKHFDKPPITYWLIGASFKVFGLNEFAGHLPLVTLGLGGIILTFFLGQTLFGNRSGFLAAIILISSLGYPAISRILSTDIIFTFFCLLCYLLFVRKRYLLFYLALALSFMTKGPVVFIIVLLPICVFFIFERKAYSFKEMPWSRGLLLFALFALPWFIYEILLNEGLMNDWVIQQTLNRVVRQLKQPVYFFVPVLIGLFFPWIFFLIPALKKNLTLRRASLDKEKSKVLFLFLWFILPFIFFSSIGKKLVPYILPLLVPLAIITARFWDQAMDKPKMLMNKVFALSYYLFLSVLGILSLGLITFLFLGFDYRLGVEAARPNIIAMAIIFVAAIAVSLPAFKAKKVTRLFWTITLGSLFFFLTAVDLMPKIEANTSKSIKALALKIKQDLKPQDKVVNYRCFLKGLPFYLERRT